MTTKAYIKPGSHIVFHPATTNSNECHKAFGAYVSNVGTSPSIDVPESMHLSPIPTDLENVLNFWSVKDNFQINGTSSNMRAIGKYHLGNSMAEVETYDSSRRQSIHVTGTDLVECVRLRDLILAGEIAPSKRYDQPQVKGAVASVRECAHRLVEALALAFDRFRLRA